PSLRPTSWTAESSSPAAARCSPTSTSGCATRHRCRSTSLNRRSRASRSARAEAWRSSRPSTAAPAPAGITTAVKGTAVKGGYPPGLAAAKSQNAHLRRELERYRQLYDQNATAYHDNLQLTKLLGYEQGPRFPSGYRPVNTRVLAEPPGQFEQQIVIAAGSNQ